MSTFSQEKRALNPVVMEVHVYDMCGWGCVQSHARTFRDLSCLKEIV